MFETLNLAICFFTALIVFYFCLPKAKRVITQLFCEYRVFVRTNRLSSSSKEYQENRNNNAASMENIGLNQKSTVLESVLFNFISRINSGFIKEIEGLLLKAGLRQRNVLKKFMRSKTVVCLLLFFILFTLFTTNDWGISSADALMLSICGGLYGGHKLTNMYLVMLAQKRLETIERGVPDLIDLLVICSESGLDLRRSIRRIARELRTSNPILADEMGLTAIELEMIPDSQQVFINLENRTDSQQIKTLSQTLSQSIKYGSSLLTSLKELAIESRQRRIIKAETAAAQAPTLLTIPMIIFIMPCLFIVMLGPIISSTIKTLGGGL